MSEEKQKQNVVTIYKGGEKKFRCPACRQVFVTPAIAKVRLKTKSLESGKQYRLIPSCPHCYAQLPTEVFAQ
jgi:RNase P subunit RPR2